MKTMKLNFASKLLFALLCLSPIFAMGQETKKIDFSLGFNYKTANMKVNSLLYKDLNGSLDAVELRFGASSGQRIIRRLETGINFSEFSANSMSVYDSELLNSSVNIKYLQIPVLMTVVYNLSEDLQNPSLVQPYISFGMNLSKHLDTKTRTLLHTEKMSSEGWNAYLRGGFGLNLGLTSNLQATIGVEGLSPIKKKSNINDKLMPVMDGVYLQFGIIYKF